MSLDAVNGYSVRMNNPQKMSYPQKAKLSSAQSFTSKPEVDEEKSNATKYMVGATALAAVIGLGIAGYKGMLGKSVREFLGGAEKAVEKGGQNASESAGSASKPLTEGAEHAGNKAGETLTGVTEKEADNIPPISSMSENTEKGVSKTDDVLDEIADKEMGQTSKSELSNEQPLNETTELKSESGAEPKTKQETEVNAEAELEAKAKAEAEAEEKAFIEKHKQVLINRLHEDGERLYRPAVKKYDELVKEMYSKRTKFAQIGGRSRKEFGFYIIEQKLGGEAKGRETIMTYYSKDGKNIDKIICTRNGEEAYQVTYRDQGSTVELEAKDLFIEGGKDGIVSVGTEKGKRFLEVLKGHGYPMEITRRYISDDSAKSKVLHVLYDYQSREAKLLRADKESICDYLNIKD